MLRANTDWKVNRRITMAPYNSRCCEQRRAESPIRIQPRAAPWVKIFQQTCALKEQKEGERTSISLSPVALTVRQLVNELTPRVLPWAVFPLGLRPVIARNHGCCTFPHLSLQISTKRLYAAKTGWKPNKNTAQGSALGKDIQLTCALKEQKEGERTSISLSPVALTARQLVNELTPRVLPWAVFPLGLRPVLAYNIGCCTLRWVISLSGLRPVFACNIGCCNARYFLCWLGVLFAISEFGVFHDTSVSVRAIPLLRYKYFPLHDNTYFCGESQRRICPINLPKNGWLKSSK